MTSRLPKDLEMVREPRASSCLLASQELPNQNQIQPGSGLSGVVQYREACKRLFIAEKRSGTQVHLYTTSSNIAVLPMRVAL